jgi:uncharacterized damage-inducible protein DinB
MFNNITDFTEVWEQERELSLKIMKAIPEDLRSKKPAEGVRTAARLCWHIAQTTTEMMERTGLRFTTHLPEEYADRTIAEITEHFDRSARELIDLLHKEWEGTDLETEDMMYGEMWSRRFTLQVLLTHLIHHRGQLTVIMRLLGIQVPGIYGPSQEEWAQMGMQAQE